MKSRLKNALALLEHSHIETLARQFLEFSFQRGSSSALIVSLINPSENKLQSWTIDQNNQVKGEYLDVDINDVDHPLIQIVSKGDSVLWPNLQQGSYIENTFFRQFVSELPVNTGLCSYPLQDVSHKTMGAITLFGQGIELNNFEQGIFPIYCAIFHHQLKSIFALSQMKQKISHLQYLNSLQQEKERVLQLSINELTAQSLLYSNKPFMNVENISSLTDAIERYEKEILLVKQKEMHGDIDAIANNLNISKRSLMYKLKKYGA